MENDTLYLEKETTFTYKISRQKKTVAGCVMAVVLAYVFFIALALWWRQADPAVILLPVFLLSGILYTKILKRNLQMLTTGEQWGFALGVSALTFVLLGFSFLWNIHLPWSSVIAGAGVFLLPFVVAELWRLYAEISFGGAVPWQSADTQLVDYPSIYLHGLPVRFEIIQEPEDSSLGVIPFLASTRMTLSDVFCDMVQKQKKKGMHNIALSSREHEPYTWVFFTNDMLLWNRTLDPNLSLLKNNVRKNAVIYVQRISGNAFDNPIVTEQNLIKP